MVDWSAFINKNKDREPKAFESLSYLLFCSEFNNRIGLFRYKNQTGIETEPLFVNGLWYGFQSKYYDKSIRENKQDIIDSIKKAKRENTQLNRFYIYVNQELSESSYKGQKKPKYQEEIEDTASQLQMDLMWKVPSNFELQIELPENKYIKDLFFNLNPESGDLIDEMGDHTELYFSAIKTSIYNHKGGKICIERQSELEQIDRVVNTNSNIVISGEGGCGKTALLKKYIDAHKDIPVCVFKASSFDVKKLNDVLRFKHDFNLSQFEEAYIDCPRKLFIIDSAEKLAEFDAFDTLRQLLDILSKQKWSIVFTVRHCYLEDLNYFLKNTFNLQFESIDMEVLGIEKLTEIAKINNIQLPDNERFKNRLCNLFYLSYYVSLYENNLQKGSFKDFVDNIWSIKIANRVFQKGNLCIRRERCIIDLAKERCESLTFYLDGNGDHEALSALKQDEIIGYDDLRQKYYITHDVFEEWSLNKIIDSAFSNNFGNHIQIFNEIGSSLPMRRAFRMWLSEKLNENADEIKQLFDGIIKSADVETFWQDELITSVLLSNYSDSFFSIYQSDLEIDNNNLFSRLLFIIRISCKKIKSVSKIDNQEVVITEPIGKGWQSVIKYLHSHRDVFISHTNSAIGILEDWTASNHTGETTKYAGELILYYINELSKESYLSTDLESQVFQIIFNSAEEIRIELKTIIERTINCTEKSQNRIFKDMCEKIISEPYSAINLIKILPEEVLLLCDTFWKLSPKIDDRFNSYYRESQEYRYGIVDEYHHNYSPASALQTPIYWLLQIEPIKTINYIIGFTNYSITCYSKSSYGRDELYDIRIRIDDTDYTQKCSSALWGLYRGVGSPVTPYLLQSMHMALEKYLLEASKIKGLNVRIEKLLIYILKNTQSVSLTSVVCSVVLANPEKYWQVALILFKTIDLFHLDLYRYSAEATIFNPIGRNPWNSKERHQSNNLLHRKEYLENLCVKYQFCLVSNISSKVSEEIKESIFQIIDNHKEMISKLEEGEKKDVFNILLCRMDSRIMQPKIQKTDNDKILIELNPQLPSDLKERSQRTIDETNEMFKYSNLRMWAIFKNELNEKSALYEYDTNCQKAFDSMKSIVDAPKSKTISLLPLDEYTPYFVSSALIRFYSNDLCVENLAFCKNVVVTRLQESISGNCHWQMSDGLEACIHSIPKLLSISPELHLELVKIAAKLLFVIQEMGNKFIFEYFIDAVKENYMWGNNREFMIAVVKLYLALCKNNSAIDVYTIILEDYKKDALKSCPIENVIVFFSVISTDNENIISKELVPSILPRLSSLLIEKKMYKKVSSVLSEHFFRYFSEYVLNSNIQEIELLMSPFVQKISGNDESKYFIQEFIVSEDKLKKVDQFWNVWNNLYDAIIKNKLQGFHADDVTINYLLAGNVWHQTTKGWHTFREADMYFYERVVGDNCSPAILYSIAFVLNKIAFNYKKRGFQIIARLINKNPNINLGGYKRKILLHIEQSLRSFIYENKEEIKKDKELYKSLLRVLDFMVEEGSYHAYMLREIVV